MTEFYYGVQEMARKANRSASSGQQWYRNMPPAEAVMVSKRSAAGWTLETWKEFAESRQEPLRGDLLKTIETLEADERDLYRKFRR